MGDDADTHGVSHVLVSLKIDDRACGHEEKALGAPEQSGGGTLDHVVAGCTNTVVTNRTLDVLATSTGATTNGALAQPPTRTTQRETVAGGRPHAVLIIALNVIGKDDLARGHGVCGIAVSDGMHDIACPLPDAAV